MLVLARIVGWIFSRPPAPLSPGQTIAWWEIRRIPYNAFIGIFGIICMEIYDWGISDSGLIPPGEDTIPPAFLFVAPLGVNICYTLGWVVELASRRILRSPPIWVGRFLLISGLGLSIVVVSGPAVIWGGWRLLTWVGIRLAVG